MQPKKGYLLESLRMSLQKQLDVAKQGFERARQSSIEAEGRMISRYDSTKEESGRLASALSGQIARLQAIQSALNDRDLQRPRSPQDTIGAGSFVSVEEAGTTNHYFIVPGGSGHQVEIDGTEILLISPSAPLAQCLVGKRLHDTVMLPDKSKPRQLTIVYHE